MRKIYSVVLMFICCSSCLQLNAQDVYQSAKIVAKDLNGTARYVSMGGALEALGADITTMSTNPAGTALFRRSQVSISGGANFQLNEGTRVDYAGSHIDINADRTRASLDQIGFVWSLGSNYQESYFNVGFTYRKSQNFDQILTAANELNGASQSKFTSLKCDYMANSLSSSDADIINNGVDANYESLMGTYKDAKGNTHLDYIPASSYRYGQYQRGYIGEYDINFSYNSSDRLYWGFTVGIHDVHYRSNSVYDETSALYDKDYMTQNEQVQIKGTGVDFKAGIIFRPWESSNFRIGAYINTPVFYGLTYYAQNDVTIQQTFQPKDSVAVGSNGQDCDYRFNLNTPWKFGVSLGDTFGSFLAVGATYEYQSNAHNSNRIRNNSGRYGGSSADEVQNSWSKQCLNGTHTIKVGIEIRPVKNFYLRAGYNFVSDEYKTTAYRNGILVSPGSSYACSTDYTNWFCTNRYTCGAGISFAKHYQIDLAYQFQRRSGSFAPFMSYEDPDGDTERNCIPQGQNVVFKRHQILATLSYKF